MDEAGCPPPEWCDAGEPPRAEPGGAPGGGGGRVRRLRVCDGCHWVRWGSEGGGLAAFAFAENLLEVSE